jgi:hypothetical protein
MNTVRSAKPTPALWWKSRMANRASSDVLCSRVASSTGVTMSGPSAIPALPPTEKHLMPVSGGENQDEMAALPACLSRYPAI